MKKLSFLFAALIVSAFVLTSCGGGKTEQAQDSTSNMEQTIAPDTTAAPAAADTTQSVQ